MQSPVLALSIVASALVASDGNHAAHEGSHDRVPTAELLRMDRTAPVCRALLEREGVPTEVRQEALESLAKASRSDVLTELLAAFERIDASEHPHAAHVLGELTGLLLVRPAAELARVRPKFESWVDRGRHPAARQAAWVALTIADGSIEQAWRRALRSPKILAEWVVAVPLLPDPGLRASAFSKVAPLLDHPSRTVREAAIGAVTALPSHERAAFVALARLVRRDEERAAALRAIRRIPKAAWSKDQVKPLLESLVAQLEKIPAAEREAPEALDALQLARDLAASLPAEEARAFRKRLGTLGTRVVLVRTVPNKMVFDRWSFAVEAGKPVVVVFENPDVMPHNLVIAAPGALAEVGAAAERMAAEPVGYANGFVPRSPKVLHAVGLIAPGGTARLSFRAPGLTGEYPFACTFPGHWRQMNGVMRVVEKLSDADEDEARAPGLALALVDSSRSFVHHWRVEELIDELPQAERARSFARGKAMFAAAACVKCHAVRGQGGTLGPDLSELPKKLAGKTLSRAELLREMLEPSKVMDPKYRPVVIATKAGAVVTGIVVARGERSVRVQSGPDSPVQEVALDDVAEQVESKVSLMPEGLLDTLSKEEILDLFAYLVAGGEPGHPVFAR